MYVYIIYSYFYSVRRIPLALDAAQRNTMNMQMPSGECDIFKLEQIKTVEEKYAISFQYISQQAA